MLYLTVFLAGSVIWGPMGYGVAVAHRWIKKMHHALKSVRAIFTLAKWGMVSLIVIVVIVLVQTGVI